MTTTPTINRPDTAAENQARRQEKFLRNLVGAETPDLKSTVAAQDAGNPFQIESEFEPAGDQPGAITELTTGLFNSMWNQVLLGVTGS